MMKIFQDEGPSLTTRWLSLKAAEEVEAARLKANPPPVEDIVIKVYLLKSNLHPEAEAEANAAAQEGVRLSKAR